MGERPTFFVDRSLGKTVGRKLRDIGAVVELHDDHFKPSTPDSLWISAVAYQGWVILTKDRNISRGRGELSDLLFANARVFTLSSGNMNGQQMAELFVFHLVEMERIAIMQQPPFVYTVGPRGLQPVQLRINAPGKSGTESQSTP